MILTFNAFQRANIERCNSGVFGHALTDWSVTDWGCALAGETGELCNLLKKIHRGDDVDPHGVRDEIGDIQAYLALVSARLGYTLEDAARIKFNAVSLRRGSKVLL